MSSDEIKETGDGIKETIYINNLNEKVSLNTLKRELEKVFKEYGDIIQITAHKNLKMKGQAFITYDSVEAAKSAVEDKKSRVLFERSVNVQYAKTNSDKYYSDIRKDETEIDKRKEAKVKRNQEKSMAHNEEPPLKKAKKNDWTSLPANEILLIQNLSADTNNDILAEYFEQFSGFINSRYVKIRNLAFLEFENEILSTKCLEDCKEEDLKKTFGDEVILTYAKR